MGDEKVISSSRHRRYGSQPISVPFLWEQKPGLPKTDWNTNPIPSVGTAISEAKPVLSREMAIIPLKFVISVPFQWEEEPGKPFLMYENPRSTVLPVAVSSWNPFINEGEDVLHACAFDMHHDSFSSDQNCSSFHGSSNEELEVKSCTRNRSHLVKRTLTLGELILLSHRLSCPKNAAFGKKHRFFPMVKPILA